jgi:hypothetical protein
MTGFSSMLGFIICLFIHLSQCHETHSIFDGPRALAETIQPCAVEDADAEELLRLKADEEAFARVASRTNRGFNFGLLCALSYRFCNADIIIPVHVHNIQDGATGRLSQSDIRDMIRQANRSFRFSGIRMDLKAIKYVNNKVWYNASVASADEIEMMRALKVGGLDTMNVYLKKAIGSNGGIYCGYTNLGAYAAQVGVRDGIVVHPECAADGKSFPHEVGHYLNLHHTFAGGCSPGDLVDDTPPQLNYVGRIKECPALFPDTCPDDSGRDPLDNMMDYNPQDCRNVFTNGQNQRMRDAWATFRDPKTRI